MPDSQKSCELQLVKILKWHIIIFFFAPDAMNLNCKVHGCEYCGSFVNLAPDFWM